MWKVQYYKEGNLAHETEVDQPYAHDALMFGHHENANQADYVVMSKDGMPPPPTAEERRAMELEEAEATLNRLRNEGPAP